MRLSTSECPGFSSSPCLFNLNHSLGSFIRRLIGDNFIFPRKHDLTFHSYCADNLQEMPYHFLFFSFFSVKNRKKKKTMPSAENFTRSANKQRVFLLRLNF